MRMGSGPGCGLDDSEAEGLRLGRRFRYVAEGGFRGLGRRFLGRRGSRLCISGRVVLGWFGGWLLWLDSRNDLDGTDDMMNATR